MSPWTALLESLHSALIDELNERLPGHKPELGMPMRQRELALPAPGLEAFLIAEMSFVREEAAAATATSSGPGGHAGDSRGIALLACDPDCRAKLQLETRALWDALIRRAGKEFMFRKIQPRLGAVTEPRAPFALPPGYPPPGRVVWIPFRLHPGICYLGVGA